MRLTRMAGSGCQGTSCPTIYRTDRGTIVVQGYVVTDAEDMAVPAGEGIVEIPASLLDELVRAVAS